MKRISSRQTFVFKRVFPALWLGLPLVMAVTGLVSFLRGKATGDDVIGFVAMPVVMLVFGVVLFRKLLWDLADDVSDGGSFLLVRRGGIEQKIPLSDVMNVSMSHSNPPRLTLRLRKLWKFGDEMVFIPQRKFSLNPFARNDIAEDLMRRCDAARQEAR